MKGLLFYRTERGSEVVLDFIRDLEREDRIKIGEDLRVVQLAHPVGPPLCKPLESGLWEVRTSLPSHREVRFICCHLTEHDAIIVLHGFVKKRQKTDRADIELALKRKREFERRQ